jgi:signal transduction histidine kinase
VNDSSPPSDPCAPPPSAGNRKGDGNATKEGADDGLARREDILSLAAHELRNPLHALALHLALARSLAESGAPGVAERIRSAERTLKRYTERVTVLMDLLGSSDGTYPLTAHDTAVPALLQAMVDSLGDEAARRGIALSWEADGQCAVRTDAVVLEQIVDNLVLNALKHSGATRVVLRCEATPAGCLLSVEDNGHGIAAEDRESVFGKFAVAHHTPRGTGSGLGLWIVKRLVAALGGSIRLLDAPGGGCRFELHLPKDADNERRPR